LLYAFCPIIVIVIFTRRWKLKFQPNLISGYTGENFVAKNFKTWGFACWTLKIFTWIKQISKNF